MLAADLSLEERTARHLDPSFILDDAGITPQDWQLDVLRHWREDHLILCSRHAGKSTVGAAMGLHCAMHIEERPAVMVGRAGRQSVEMFRMARVMYDALPASKPSLLVDTTMVLEFDNRARILALPGDPDTVRGISGASAVLVDEAGLVPDDMLAAVEPMLATSGGPLWIMGTAAGKRGFFYDFWSDPMQPFRRVMITAEDCPHISKEFLDKRRPPHREKWRFEQEYLCVFHDTNEQIFGSVMIENAITQEVGALWA